MRCALLVATAVLAGCGSSPGDLLALDVSGGPSQGHETLVVRVDGTASCNGGPQRTITNAQLLEADAVVRDAKPYATRAQTYPSGRAGGRQFALRDQDGTVRWSESSAGVPPALARAELFALRVGPLVCGR